MIDHEIKVRYTFKDLQTGKIEKIHFTISEIETNSRGILDLLKNPFVELLSRDEFTGLKDKNDSEIYERDIVQIVCNELVNNEIEAFRSEVVFYDGGFSYIEKSDGYEYPLSGVCSENGALHEGSHFCEVVENPEFLNGVNA